MKKRLTRVLAIIGFLFAIGAVGAQQYLAMTDGKPHVEAAEAVANVANAALDWTNDRGERHVEVVLLIGQTPNIVSVRALLTMRGGSHLSAVCATLPRVHDAINLMLFDQIRDGIVKGYPGGGVELAAYEAPLKERLNRSYDEPTIETLRLSRGNAAMGDSGCTDKNARRDKPQEAAHH
jgi:hypothetical protein